MSERKSYLFSCKFCRLTYCGNAKRHYELYCEALKPLVSKAPETLPVKRASHPCRPPISVPMEQQAASIINTPNNLLHQEDFVCDESLDSDESRTSGRRNANDSDQESEYLPPDHDTDSEFEKRRNAPPRKYKGQDDKLPMHTPIVQEFLLYLQGPLGGGKKPKTIEKLISSFQRLAYYVIQAKLNANNQSANDQQNKISLFNIIENQQFLMNYLNRKQGFGSTLNGRISTARTIMKLCDYLETQSISPDQRNYVAQILKISKGLHSTALKQLRDCRPLVTCEEKTEAKTWLSMNELGNIPNLWKPDWIRLISKVKHEQARLNKVERKTALIILIGFIFLRSKACRPMSIYSLNMKHYPIILRDGMATTNQFKTAYKYGLDTFIFNAELTEMMKEYIENIRIQSTKDVSNDSPLIVHHSTGKRLAQLSEYLKLFIFLKTGVSILPTTLRQVWESYAYSNFSADQQTIIGSDLKHSSKVVKDHYLFVTAKQVALQNFKLYEQAQGNSNHQLIEASNMNPNAITSNADHEQNNKKRNIESGAQAEKKRKTMDESDFNNDTSDENLIHHPRLAWSKEETEFLLQAVRREGKRWKSIYQAGRKQNLFKNRIARHLQSKYFKLQTKHSCNTKLELTVSECVVHSGT